MKDDVHLDNLGLAPKEYDSRFFHSSLRRIEKWAQVLSSKGTVNTSTAYTDTIKLTVYTVATLPTGVAGSKAFVSDANATTFASVVAGGGANGVPVYNDGTNWRIG